MDARETTVVPLQSRIVSFVFRHVKWEIEPKLSHGDAMLVSTLKYIAVYFQFRYCLVLLLIDILNFVLDVVEHICASSVNICGNITLSVHKASGP